MFEKMTSFTDSAFEKIDNFINKKIVIWAIVILTTILGSIYYYGIISITKPNAEDCLWPYQEFLSRLNGTHIGFSNIIDRISFTISYNIHGFCFKMPWLNFTLRYSAILFCSLVLSIILNKKSSKYSNIYTMPIIYIFMILLPVLSNKGNIGFYVDPVSDVFAGYDFNYHQTAIIMALLCMITASLYLKKYQKNINVFFSFLTVVLFFYGIKKTDLIFCVMFAAPLLIVLFLYCIKSEKYNKYTIWLVFGIMMFFLFTKFVPLSSIHELFWNSDAANVYGSRVYGEISWRLTQDPVGNLENFYRLVINIFGLYRTDTTVLSIWSVVLIIKMILTVLGFYIAFSVIIATMNNSANEKEYDFVDQICAFAVVIFSFIDIFTYLSISVQCSYFMGMLICVTILLARNLTNVIDKICNISILENVRSRVLLLLISCMFVLLSVNNVWAYHIDTNGSDIDKCIEYIYETGNGYVIAPHYLFGRLAMQSEGKVLFFGTEDQLKNYMGESATPRYIVSKLDEDSLFYNYDSSCSGHYGNFGQEDIYSFKKLTDKYGEPIETKKFGNIWIHRLW